MTNKSFLKGKTFNYPQSIGERYSKKTSKTLFALYRELKEQLKKEEGVSSNRIVFNKLLKKYNPLFNDIAIKSTKNMIDDALEFADYSVRHSLVGKFTIDTTKITSELREIIKASSIEAVSYIQQIPNGLITTVQNEVMRSVVGGTGLEGLIPFLKDAYNYSDRKVKLTALDQTRKVYNGMVNAKCKQAGFEYYIWRHTSGSKYPRKDHIDMDGKIYRFDDPPIVVKETGEKGIPGTAINCRCRMQPILVLPGEKKPKVG